MMKKTMKRILSVALVSAMVLSMSITAFAANPKTYTLDDGGSVTFSDVTKEEAVTLSFVESVDNGDFVSMVNTERTVTLVYLPDGATIESATGYPRGGMTYVEIDGGWWEGIGIPFEDCLGTVTTDDFCTYTDNASYDLISLGSLLFYTTDKMLGDTEAVEPEVITAAPTDSTVLVDGENASFEAYNIDDNNYFKLRDIAQILSGSDAQFEVTWDGEKEAINMVTGEAYTAVGGELATGDGTAKEYVSNTSTIYLNGEEVSLTAYTINDNNYFKLRDLGEAIGFNVSWDNDANSIVIASDEAYTAD